MTVLRSFRPRIGRSGTRPSRRRTSSENRIGIDSRCWLGEPRILPITWDRRLWRGQRQSRRLRAARRHAAILTESIQLATLHQSSRGNAMTRKEFQESNLAVELKTGRKRLEEALRGLSEEQCERPGATRSGSVVDLLSGIVTKEFLTLMKVSDRLPSLPMNLPAKADGQTRSLPRKNGLNQDNLSDVDRNVIDP